MKDLSQWGGGKGLHHLHWKLGLPTFNSRMGAPDIDFSPDYGLQSWAQQLMLTVVIKQGEMKPRVLSCGAKRCWVASELQLTLDT